jgi:signal transduction histidine kinase
LPWFWVRSSSDAATPENGVPPLIAEPRLDDVPKQMPTILQRRRHLMPPKVVDIWLAILIALPALPAVVRHRHGLGGNEFAWWALLIDLGLAIPLIWRRRAPAVVFGIIAAVAFVQWLTGERIFAVVALLVAFYTVASRESRRLTVAAAIVLEVGALLASVRWAGEGHDLVLFVLLSGMVTAAGVIGTHIRTRRDYLMALEERAARLEVERDQQARLAVAAERARIARDMHDVVAHNLSVMIALADGASFTADADPGRAATAMSQVSATGRQALTEMRRLLGVLRDDQPATLQPQPGVADLDRLMAQVRLTGLRGELVSEGDVCELQPGLQLTVYRLVQEALTNTLKHAVDAEFVTVRLRYLRSTLEVEVVDDGAVRERPVADTAGHGITGMRERAAVYGGTVEAGPCAGRGWRVRASFDLVPDEEPADLSKVSS